MATWKMSRRKIFDLWECSVLCLLPWLSTDDGIDWERDGDVDAREEQHSVPLPMGSLPGHTGAPMLYGFKTDARWVNQWMVTNWSKVSAFLDHSIPWGDWLSWKKAGQSIMHWISLTGLWLRPDFNKLSVFWKNLRDLLSFCDLPILFPHCPLFHIFHASAALCHS